MSTAPFPSPYPNSLSQAITNHLTGFAGPRARTRPHVIRRRPTMQQGLALEKLGHAIEYLVDSRLHIDGEQSETTDVQSRHILMRVNREIFGECSEIVPIGRRVATWLTHILRGEL